ncbi:putative exonuclease GOR [Daphnia pulicaria]|uniref:putative exonuclease GOR n=1 Tax=Daphnia pulicaria TaxID=35523 RepID=UPI001EEBC66D|nr:putative exonuclease GOR [Daphnia pulicaria]
MYPSVNIDPSLLKGPVFYKLMGRHIISLKQQETNGYPRPHPIHKTRAVINSVEIDQLRSKPAIQLKSDERICDRCSTIFKVDSRGCAINHSADDECSYHWGRSFRNPGTNMTSPFSCCGSDRKEKGCATSKHHVFNIENLKTVDGFVHTMDKPPLAGGDYGVYAMDCEMCYTTEGGELTRITIVSSDLKIVYDTLVKPDNSVVDYNTRFSGISERDLKHVMTKLKDVQIFLLNLLSSKTILIGHGLGSDLRALRLIHDTVIDTSIVFPHSRGPPYKRGLKKLILDHFQKHIQKDGGHNSVEDAIACMELMLWKIKPFLCK